MLDVIGVGTNSVDEVMQLSGEMSAILLSGKARVTSRHVIIGGQTATVTAACAALGLKAGYIGAFGSDANGGLARHALMARDVDLTHCVFADAPNRGAFILVDAAGRRTVLWHRSERLTVPPHVLTPESLAARIVHVDDDDLDLALNAARAARAAGALVTSDIEHPSDRVEQLITDVTCPVFEERLPTLLTGERDHERALRKLRRLNSGLLVMTLGRRGAVALEGDRFHAIPAFDVTVADSTGAGDVFRAGLIYGILQKWPVPAMLRFANATAAVSCTRLGAIPSVPTLAEVRALEAAIPY
ncbi:MAG: carbohydrate kinase family protein [Acidobacteria bacterium]|nr:MAG: carbohydrate kinase family protein [Acidobacteriota bacterium]